jgi:hypothetical protein
MRRGCSLAPNKDTTPTDAERGLIQLVIRDCHVSTVSEWVVNQKPKIRSKFLQFLAAVSECPVPTEYCNASGDIAERLARDIARVPFHPVLRRVIDDSNGDFSDVLHILSLHMQRSNVMASVPSVRDISHRLIKAIAQEDHVYSRPVQPKHELPKAAAAQALTRARMADPLPNIGPTRSCRPGTERSSPFACFPSGEKMESTTKAQFVNFSAIARTEKSGVYNVLNGRTCL